MADNINNETHVAGSINVALAMAIHDIKRNDKPMSERILRE